MKKNTFSKNPKSPPGIKPVQKYAVFCKYIKQILTLFIVPPENTFVCLGQIPIHP